MIYSIHLFPSTYNYSCSSLFTLLGVLWFHTSSSKKVSPLFVSNLDIATLYYSDNDIYVYTHIDIDIHTRIYIITNNNNNRPINQSINQLVLGWHVVMRGYNKYY